MKFKHHQVATCLLALSVSAQAKNQSDQPQLPYQELTNLVVSAGISPVEMNQFGGTVSIISAEQIEAIQATYLSDILRQVPGFAINQSGGPGTQTQLRVRGSEANHVLVLLNGIRINDPTASDEYLFNYGLTNNIERIEVIRGPQSAIWGTDAVSAVINIITKESKDPEFNASLEAGSFNSNSIGLSGAMAENNWFVNAEIKALDSAGTNVSRTGREEDGFENLSTHLRWGIELTDTIEMKLSLNHSDSMNEFDGTDFVTTGLPVDADLWTEREQSTAQLAFTINPNDRWQHNFHYNWSDIDAQNFTHGIGETSSTAAETNELKFNSTVWFGNNNKHRLSVAADHRQIDFIQRGEASQFGDPNQKQDYHVNGFAFEYHQATNEHFSWNISARSDQFNRFNDASNFKLGGSYQLTDSSRLRGSFGTGSKAPSFIERFGFFPANFIGNPQLKPEQSDAFELAWVKSWNSSQFEIIFFNQDLTDEINGFVFDPDSGLFTAANQDGESKRQGFEFNWSRQINDAVVIGLNYTYTDATEEDATGDNVTEVRRPENMANLTVNYQFADDRAQLFARVNYVDDQLDVFFDPTTFNSSNVKLDAYSTVDVTFNWQFNDELTAYLKAQNIFDETYEEVLGYARPGANFAAGLKFQF